MIRPHTTPDDAAQIRAIDTPAAAALLGVSTRTLEKMRLTGDGPPFVRVSKTCVRYRVRDLSAWQASRLRTSTADRR